MDLMYDRRLRLNGMLDDYKCVGDFAGKTKRMNYVQFDYAVVHDLTLFMQDPDFDFDELEKRTDVILKALPAIKRIFAQPFIHLKEHDVIMPVEAVRIVNNATLNHIATHSELWTDVKNDEIKPEKLLTRTYEDNYGIYENLVFCNVVDEILAYARANIRFLRELIYANRTIEINLLERVNHLSYFLALGKLHIGYSKNFEAYYATASRCLNKLLFIVNGIVPRLKRPVYKNNKRRPASLKIRKTNILSMHKEYHQVYKLAKRFALDTAAPLKDISEKELAALESEYALFCGALCIFSVGHFNFTCDESKDFDLRRPVLDFSFKDWRLGFKRINVGGLPLFTLDFDKDKSYRIALVPSLEEDTAALIARAKKAVAADEYIACTPYEECGDDCVFIDITSIESFRRLQQIVLRGMIASDAARVDCPFCGGKLAVDGEKSSGGGTVYACATCRTEICDSRCEEKGERFVYTTIAGLDRRPDGDGSWLYDRETEGRMYFRNITRLDDDGEPICPHCGKAHK